MQTNIHFSSHLSQFFLEWKMFQIKVVEEIKTQILLSITFFENRAIYEIMWKNIVHRCRPYGGWITRATHTHSQYVTLIAFPLQQWLQGRLSMLRYSRLFVLFDIMIVWVIAWSDCTRLETGFLSVFSWKCLTQVVILRTLFLKNCSVCYQSPKYKPPKHVGTIMEPSLSHQHGAKADFSFPRLSSERAVWYRNTGALCRTNGSVSAIPLQTWTSP